MNRSGVALFSLLLTFTVGVAAATAWLTRRAAPTPQQRQETPRPPAPPKQAEPPPRREFSMVIPQDTWEPIFFESINERAQRGRLPNLRAPLPAGDLELRIWGGFGLTGLEGFRLVRAGGRWSATHLDTDYGRGRLIYSNQNLGEPKSGWEGAWNRLLSLGILELPDAESALCSAGITDGFSYVVEANVSRLYRTYMYDNPDHSECAEARRMLSIAEAVADEFGVEEFSREGGSRR